MAFEEAHLDFCLATVKLNTKIAFEEFHLDFCLATGTMKTRWL
jgi:hypothetical protein